MEAAGDGSMDMFRGTPGSATTIGRSAEVAGILNKMVNGLGAIVLDIRSSDESTIHPANGLLIQALQIYSGNTHLVQPVHNNTTDPYSHMVDRWAAKLEKDAEMIRQGKKGGKYIFLLNNTYDVCQMVRRPRASFASAELASRIMSMIQRYKECYFDECWVPLNRLNLDKFTAEFRATCNCQSTWKVTAELKHHLRQEIVDFIVPPYEASLSDRSRHSGVSFLLKRLMVGEKKQKKYTGAELEEEIRGLFEG